MALPAPDVGDDLSRATTLPSAWYTDPEALALEQTAVFARTWQLAAPLTQLSVPGDYVACNVAGEPLVLVRESPESLRGFSAVCRHRAGPVACGAGNRRSFQCGYHGWTYGLDGRLLTAPEFEGVLDWDREAVRLPQVRLDTWDPFAFVNLDPAAPSLARWMPEVFAQEGPRTSTGLVSVERREWRVQCNWKVYVDNYLEGYHIPIVHPGLFRELDYGGYRVEPYEHVSAQIAPIRRGSGPERRYPSGPGQDEEAIYLWVFPNLMLNLYPDNLQVNLVLPVSQHETRTIFEWFVPADEGSGERLAQAIAFAEEVQREDVAICEAVQRGLGSRTYNRGRYSVRRENGVYHFHRPARALPDPRRGPECRVDDYRFWIPGLSRPRSSR